MSKNDGSTTASCPIANATVDAERCVACYRRGPGSATCAGEDRLSASDLRFLLLAL